MVKKIYELYLENGGTVSTDSRNASGLFFALKGEKFDANLFAEGALDSGAKYAIVDNPEVAKDERYILVDNVLETLQKLANFHRRHLTIPVLAITGTNGKTTTKELVRDVLKKKYNVVATEGNYNNHIGVPLTLLSIGVDAEFAVVEMGANHPGEIETLCKIVEPDYGLITNIGVAHLEGFGSEEGIRKTKGELYDYLSQAGRKAFYNSDDMVLLDMINKRPSLESIPYHIEASAITSNEGLLSFEFEGVVYPTHFVGNVNLMNVSAALNIGKYFGINQKDAFDAITEYIPSNNRSQILKTDKGNTLVMDAYNANPSSMLLAIDNFGHFPSQNKCIILGQMNELGERSKQLHCKVLEAALNVVSRDSLFLVGEKFFEIIPDRSFKTVAALVEFLSVNQIKCQTILVKGSRGNSLEILKDYL